MAKKKDKDDIQLTELTMAKAGWHRTYLGSMHRYVDSNGNKFVTGKVTVNEGHIWSLAADKYELSRNLDAICKHKLDLGLHARAGETDNIAGTRFFLN
jgi:hypothetical protein